MAIFNLIASNIENLELKLKGELPVNRDELLALVNSWGRSNWFITYNKDNEEIDVNNREIKEEYDLSKLDVSKITNFNSIFKHSYFNGDINFWDVSNATSMVHMFCGTINFNLPLNNWNVSKVTSMHHMFYESKIFNQNINSWDVSNVKNMNYIFEKAKSFNQPILWDLSKVEYCNGMFSMTKAFQNRFNNRQPLPNETDKIKVWLIENKMLMEAIHIEKNKSKELDKFLSDLNVIDSTNLNGLHNIITSTKLNELHDNKDIIIN